MSGDCVRDGASDYGGKGEVPNRRTRDGRPSASGTADHVGPCGRVFGRGGELDVRDGIERPRLKVVRVRRGVSETV